MRLIMRKFWLRGSALTWVLLWSFVSLSPNRAGSNSETGLTLKGTVLVSFNEPHALVQTSDYVVRIILEKIPIKMRPALLRIGAEVSVKIPIESVDIAWLVQRSEVGEVTKISGPTQIDSLKLGAKKKDGLLQLKGHVLTSFSEESGLVQVGQYAYRLNLSKLTPLQIKQIRESSDLLKIEIPSDAIEFAWRVAPESSEQEMSRKPANVIIAGSELSDSDGVIHHGSRLELKGRTLQSFSDPHVLLRSGDTIYRIKKSGIMKSDFAKMEEPGRSVELKVDVSAVEYAWKVGSQK